MNNRQYLIFLFAFIFAAGCGRGELGTAPVPDDYEESIQEWKEYRIDRLTEPTGWLRLADLIWLEEGENRFGSGEDTEIQFPEGTIPEFAGTFLLRDGQVVMHVADGVTITHDGEPVDEMVIFDGENRPEIEHADLTWYVDTRGDRHGIRIYNQDTPRADAFDGFPAYPLDPAWHLKAKFIQWENERAVEVVNVLGDTIERSTPGKLQFKAGGELHSLTAFESSSGLFIMFSDETNREETYQAGRYMIVDHPDENGHTILDFNKAYNAPCSFSLFSTCQLPPPENRLDIAIEAGEKRPVGWEGI